MAGFKTAFFKGLRPRMSALKLPEGEAVTATNLKLGSGDLVPWTDVDAGTAVDDTFRNKTIYRYDNADAPVWFEWSNAVSVARGTVKGDTQERIYYTGDGVPKMTYRDIASAGPGPYPQAFRKLGIPAPTVPPTALGSSLPESLSTAERRVTANTLFAKKLEIAFVNWVVYPGAGTATAEWTRPAGAFTGDIYFDMSVGDTIRILEVLDEHTVLLGSATGTGAVAETANNDKVTGNVNWELMQNEGNTQTADWVGWRVLDGLKVTIPNHLLRVGDVIRVTRLDYNNIGLFLTIPASTLSFWEQSWATEGSVTVDGSTFTQTVKAVVGADAAGEANFPTLKGSFYYEVVREASEATVLEDRTYRYTYVSALGEEGPPSRASLVVQALDGDAVEITGIEPPPTDGYDITTINLYRTSSTESGTEYQFVTEFSVADLLAGEPLTESVKQANLGTIIESTTWDGPPAGMQGIAEMPNGMLVGFVGRTLHFCEPYFPHAWPPEYDKAVDYDIVGLAPLGNSVVVLTEGKPYVLAGAHPRNASARPYELKQACVSAESIASDKDKVFYASPDGLVEISVNGARLVTEPYVLKAEWAAYEPTTMVGEFHDGKYFGFFDGEDNVPQAPASVAVTGTLSTEAGVIAGAQTIILTLTTDTWLDAGGSFDGTRQSIIDGLLATTDFITGFNIAVRPNIAVGTVVRTDATTVTITLAARAEYSITAAEAVGVTVPASALTTSTIALIGDTTLAITPLEDYSSRVMAFSEMDATLEVPYAISSHLDITDWDPYAGVGTTFKAKADINAAAYSPSLDRWLAVGQRANDAPAAPNTPVFSTSDDGGVSWAERTNAYNLFTDTAVGPLAAIWDPRHATFVVGGANRSLQASPDGEAWTSIPVDLLVPTAVSISEFALSTAGVPDHIYGICSSALFLLRSPDLKLTPVTNTWTSVPVTYVSATGSKHIASGASVLISIGADDTDMEVCETVHGAATGASVGAINSYNCRGITYGNDLWVTVSNDFKIVTCATGDQGTIGNWSGISGAKAAGVNMKGIVYDDGDEVTQGYGYIAFGEIIASGLGVVYTSPDAATWTLRYTATPTIDIDAMAVKYPEPYLGDALTDYSPSYNGAQAPTELGDTYANYTFTGGAPSGCTAIVTLTVEFEAADALIRINGVHAGNIVSSDIGDSFAEAGATIFNLNAAADSVRITITELDHSEGAQDGDQFGRTRDEMVGVQPIFGLSGTGPLYDTGEFVEDVFFTPVAGFEYGFQLKGLTSAYYILPSYADPVTINSAGFAIITFTFRRTGYEDISVSYKIHVESSSTSASS